MSTRLSHTDARGRVRMVDVGAKPETAREAVASAAVRMSTGTMALAMGEQIGQIAQSGQVGKENRAGTASGKVATKVSTKGSANGSAKGDVLATARVAAIAALKRTSDWIPLCHPVRLVGCEIDIQPDETLPGLRVRVTVRAFDRTGVEMEALVGASAAALTIYDMVKAVERGVEILNVRLEEKRGGRSGTWRRQPQSPVGQEVRGRRLTKKNSGRGQTRQ
ncbi:MAG: cyclic pyranopterin monophosphate synthase MoaC [Deltaproteobacteria bacterium]|nr:cyclic pyranopterin monophosphate synthase MoaC [Deltaproteobacteria bacterium]